MTTSLTLHYLPVVIGHRKLLQNYSFTSQQILTFQSILMQFKNIESKYFFQFVFPQKIHNGLKRPCWKKNWFHFSSNDSFKQTWVRKVNKREAYPSITIDSIGNFQLVWYKNCWNGTSSRDSVHFLFKHIHVRLPIAVIADITQVW